MAEQKNTQKGDSGTTRRGFIGAIGAAAVGASLPAGAAPPPAWPNVQAQIPALRAAYMAEVARLAETLRPRFEAGEIRANREVDFARFDEPGVRCTREDLENMPMGRVERIVAEHFGLVVTVTDDADVYGSTFEGDGAAAYLVLACSPNEERVGDSWGHPCYHAQTSAALDLITAARARGMYVPTADEEYFEGAGEVRS